MDRLWNAPENGLSHNRPVWIDYLEFFRWLRMFIIRKLVTAVKSKSLPLIWRAICWQRHWNCIRCSYLSPDKPHNRLFLTNISCDKQRYNQHTLKFNLPANSNRTSLNIFDNPCTRNLLLFLSTWVSSMFGWLLLECKGWDLIYV